MRNKRASLVNRSFSVLLIAMSAGFAAQRAQAAKNVIVMVADGAGFNTWIATSMYLGQLGEQVYDGDDWVQTACRTQPLNRSESPTGDNQQAVAIVYDPGKAWDRKVGYGFLKDTYTDSAAAATAMASGQKTYNNAINWLNTDRPIRGRTIPEISKAQGKAVGVVTSVEWSHATPACFGGAHNVSRNNYVEIAREMLDAPYLDVIMGTGHPEFDDNGRPRKASNAQYVGGREVWKQLQQGTHPGGWRLVQTKAEFEALVKGPTPAKVLGVAQAATTLQQKRNRPAGDGELVFQQPKNAKVPSLATMTSGALNCLDDDPQGFFLMVEGGAVDWANHSNQENRMIEEQIEFLRAVEAVMAWVEAHSSWDETLLILTADHECGLIWGPDADIIPFAPVVDMGKLRQPRLRYLSDSHTNSLVPLYARGSGSRLFADMVVGDDRTAAAKWGFSGQYVDNTAIFNVTRISVTAPTVEPAAPAPR